MTMKSCPYVSVAAALLVAVVVVSGAQSAVAGRDANRRVARGFRLGAADRFSHGFGKRAGSNNGLLEYMAESSPELALPIEDFAELLRSSQELAESFVRNTVDRNRDGLVTKDELLGYQN